MPAVKVMLLHQATWAESLLKQLPLRTLYQKAYKASINNRRHENQNNRRRETKSTNRRQRDKINTKQENNTHFPVLPCGLQARDNIALQEARSWQQNAAAWGDSLLKQFPLYTDLLQPVGLAVHEVRYGLSLMLHSVGLEKTARDSAVTSQLGPALVADLLAFPSRPQQGRPAVA